MNRKYDKQLQKIQADYSDTQANIAIHPDKGEAFAAWAQTTIPRLLASPGLVELRGYRPATGSSHVAVTFEFADLAAWATWMADETIKEILVEARAYQVNQQTELWGPSPVLPEPLRPGS